MTDVRGISPAEAYEYLVKARAKLLDWVRPLTLEQYTREFPFGLKTLRQTLVEIPLAEWSYIRRMRGLPTVASREQHPFWKYYDTEFTPLEAPWRDLAEDTRSTLREITDWNQVVEYTPVGTDRPMRIRTTTGGIATQLLFHEIHHRAQAMAMLRHLGIPAQNLDYSILMFERVEVPA